MIITRKYKYKLVKSGTTYPINKIPTKDLINTKMDNKNMTEPINWETTKKLLPNKQAYPDNSSSKEQIVTEPGLIKIFLFNK